MVGVASRHEKKKGYAGGCQILLALWYFIITSIRELAYIMEGVPPMLHWGSNAKSMKRTQVNKKMAGTKLKAIGEDLKRYIAERREHKPRYPLSVPMLLEAEEKEKDKQQDMVAEGIIKTLERDEVSQCSHPEENQPLTLFYEKQWHQNALEDEKVVSLPPLEHVYWQMKYSHVRAQLMAERIKHREKIEEYKREKESLSKEIIHLRQQFDSIIAEGKGSEDVEVKQTTTDDTDVNTAVASDDNHSASDRYEVSLSINKSVETHFSFPV